MGHRSHDHEGHGSHERDRFGNPKDLDEYLRRLEGAERAAWQKPDEVVAALGLRPGDTAGEIGAGPGYFALRLARAVGPAGRVLAAEAHPRMLALLQQRAAAAGLANVVPLAAEADDPRLPDRSCDLVLLVNAFHHFPDPAAYLRRVAGVLRPGGRIVNVDFHERELPVGPPPERKLSREAFLALAGEAGLRLASEQTFLPYQYFVELKPAAAHRP